jgi:hypothetical protein
MENHLLRETICGTRGKYQKPRVRAVTRRGSRFAAALPDGAVKAEDSPLLSGQEAWAAVLTRVIARPV